MLTGYLYQRGVPIQFGHYRTLFSTRNIRLLHSWLFRFPREERCLRSILENKMGEKKRAEENVEHGGKSSMNNGKSNKLNENTQ